MVMQVVSKANRERKTRPAYGVGSGRDSSRRKKGSKSVDQLCAELERDLPRLKKLLKRA